MLPSKERHSAVISPPAVVILPSIMHPSELRRHDSLKSINIDFHHLWSFGPACIGYEIYSLVSGYPSRELIKVYKHLGLEKPDNPITLENLRLDGMLTKSSKTRQKKQPSSPT